MEYNRPEWPQGCHHLYCPAPTVITNGYYLPFVRSPAITTGAVIHPSELDVLWVQAMLERVLRDHDVIHGPHPYSVQRYCIPPKL